MRFAATLLWATLASAALVPSDIKDVVSFGDSLSDNGNLFAAYGVPPAPYWQGRFSNGPVWVEYLTKFIPNAKLHDFAVGSACATVANAQHLPLFTGSTVTTSDIPDLMAQFGLFQNATASKLNFHSTLFTVWAGGNDFDFAMESGKIVSPPVVAAAVITAVDHLISMGAVNVMVNTLPSLDETPLGASMPAFAALLKLASSMFNAGIVAGVAQLSAKYPQANVILTDASIFFNHALMPSFGFTDVDHKCFNGTEVCDTPDTFLFWDRVHPTTMGHNLLGQYAYNQAFGIPGWVAPESVVNPPAVTTAAVTVPVTTAAVATVTTPTVVTTAKVAAPSSGVAYAAPPATDLYSSGKSVAGGIMIVLAALALF
ncbi:hypothetical protein HDU98_011754 [Podochytrium sp. JEL0797]|nr:hypothetical protein HDU98_011754 [Podochytrium sp. JEL0797]